MWTIDHEFVRGGRSKRGNASRNMLSSPIGKPQCKY